MRTVIMVILGGLMYSAYTVAANVTLIADPKVLSIPVQDSNEPMVNLVHQTVVAYGPSPEIPNNTDYTYLRQTVYEKLKKAEHRLPKGLHFCLYEGYRSIALQKMLFDKRSEKVKKNHPDWPSSALFAETTKLVSPVINEDGSDNIPPHSTGGALDVYLINDQGEPVDMGIHPKDWMQDEGGVLSQTASNQISINAQKNRQIMSEALALEGFINYPTEYWHWSYGDRYWAYMTQHKHTLYGQYDRP